MDVKTDTSLNGNNDLVTPNNDVVFIERADETSQLLFQRIKTYLEEEPLDVTIGLEYFQRILIKAPNSPIVHAIFTREILDTPGVEELRRLEIDLDNRTRELTVSADIIADNELITFVA